MYEKFHQNPSNFIAWNQRWFKLDLKKVTPTVFRPAVDKGLIQRVNIFCMENGHVCAFNTLTKNRENWMRVSCWFLRLKKIGHYFCRRVYTTTWARLCRSGVSQRDDNDQLFVSPYIRLLFGFFRADLNDFWSKMTFSLKKMHLKRGLQSSGYFVLAWLC